jgi:hypothetical protein
MGVLLQHPKSPMLRERTCALRGSQAVRVRVRQNVRDEEAT